MAWCWIGNNLLSLPMLICSIFVVVVKSCCSFYDIQKHHFIGVMVRDQGTSCVIPLCMRMILIFSLVVRVAPKCVSISLSFHSLIFLHNTHLTGMKFCCDLTSGHQNLNSVSRFCLTIKGISTVEIRWSHDHLISTMRFHILVTQNLCIESATIL